MNEQLHTGKAKYSSIFNYPTLNWADIGAVGWLVDGAAIVNQVSLQRTSFGPYARGMVRICKEESFHQRQGYEIMAEMAMGSQEQKETGSGCLESFVVAILNDVRLHTMQIHPTREMQWKWKIKRESNDELRQKFIDKTVDQAKVIGLSIPDPDLKWNEERGHYDFGEINWDEFYQVINGNGPNNVKRLAHHKRAHDEGEWGERGCYSLREKTNH